MEKHWWATDGCRLFTGEFKREQLAGGGGGGSNGRSLRWQSWPGICRSPRRSCGGSTRLSTPGSTAGVGAKEDVVPPSELRLALGRIKGLERALGKKAMEIEIVQAAWDEVKKGPHYYGVSKR